MDRGKGPKGVNEGAPLEEQASIYRFNSRIQRSAHVIKKPTSFFETLIHLVKGNVGAGVFAMGDAFKNGGLILSPILVAIVAITSLYCNHMIVKASMFCKEKFNLGGDPNFPETVDICFETGPECFRKMAHFIRVFVKVLIISTQLGFCTTYFVVVASTLKLVCAHHNVYYSIQMFMAMMLGPVLLTCFIRTLKILSAVSLISNLCLIVGITITLVMSCFNLPPFSSRSYYGEYQNLPLFLGTVLFAYEGISLIIPLRNEMRKPESFSRHFGVLNIGLFIVTLLFVATGLIGYWKYGESVKGSLTLNLPPEQVLSDVVQILVALGIMLSYALQFYVAAELLWVEIDYVWGPFRRETCWLVLLRIILVGLTFVLAATIPKLNLFISLVGAIGGAFLCLFFPPLCDVALRKAPVKPLHSRFNKLYYIIDFYTLVVAFLGFVLGTFCSVKELVISFQKHGMTDD